MDLRPLLSSVESQMLAVAALGDEQTRAVAAALATAAEPAVRLALAATAAATADEVTVALLDTPGAPTVAVRLDSDEIRVEIRPGQPVAPAVDLSDDDSTARISLRLPEALKSNVEAAARRDGVSVNAWLVRAAGAALGAGHPGGGSRSRTHEFPMRLHGWING